MAIRIPWNEYEQAILLQALIDVLDHNIERKQAIFEVSRRLRAMAVAQGITIDDKFRNENGIGLQMDCLRFAYTDGESGLHVTRGWYFDIVQKYKSDREEYETLLQGANKMTTTTMDNKIGLKTWLENMRSEKDAADIMSSLSALEVLLRKNHVINSRLFEIENSDEISEIIEKIKNNSGIRIHAKNNKSKAIRALNAYKDFLQVQNEDLALNVSKEHCAEKSTKLNTVSTKPNVDFCVWLTETERLAEKTGRSYSSAINNCNLFCQDHGIGTGRIYGAESLDEVARNIALLQENVEFQKTNDIQHNRLTAALAKYQKFLGLQKESVGAETNGHAVSQRHDINQDEIARITATLALPRFEYGFKDDYVELYRFRASYAQTNETECILDDDALLEAIRNIGFEFEGKVYLISDRIKEAIKIDIVGYENQGVNIIYYEQLYDFKSDTYFEEKIVSPAMLKAILKCLMPKYRYKSSYFAVPSERLNEIELVHNDIERVWGDGILQTYDDISAKLPLIPFDKIKFVLAQQATYVWNSAETYLQFARFEADENEVSFLINYIDEQCEKRGGALIDEIPLDNLRMANPEFSETAIVACFCKLVENHFERNDRVLTRKGARVDTYTAVIEFCRKQTSCTYERLEELAKRVSGTVRQPEILDAANAVMVRVDKDKFISDNQINFDVDKIDACLDYIVTDNFIGMKEILTFSTFPYCGYRWNLFLLESYCRRFSKRYKYDTRRANSSNSGAVVAKTCTLDYHDIMAHAVARSDRDLNKPEVFDFLTETGYMERKRYNAIDSLINEALLLRERRE